MNIPVISQFQSLVFPVHQELKLPNGVKVHIINHGTQPVTQLMMLWDGGTSEAANPYVPMLAMRTLRHGSRSMTAEQIEQTLDYNGATLSPSLHDHHTGISLTFISERMKALLPLLSELIEAERPVNEESTALFEQTRRELIASRRVLERRVDNRASEACMPLIAGAEHPLSRVAEERYLREVTMEDVARERYRLMRPSGMTVYISGRMAADDLDALLTLLGKLEDDGDHAVGVVKISPFTPQLLTRRDVAVEGAMQNAILMMLPTITRDNPDYCDLRVSLYALGGYFGSRLMQTVRESHGLTYGINALLYGYPEGGIAAVATNTSPESVDTVLELSAAEMRRLVTEPPSGEELERVRQRYLTTLAQILDSPFKIAGHIAARQLSLTPDDYFERQFDSAKSITPDRISDLAKRYLDPEQARIVVAGEVRSK